MNGLLLFTESHWWPVRSLNCSWLFTVKHWITAPLVSPFIIFLKVWNEKRWGWRALVPPCGVIGQEFVGFSLGKYPISFPADGDALLPSCGVAYKHTFIFMQSCCMWQVWFILRKQRWLCIVVSSGSEPVHVSKALQKAKIIVNEDGTKAAAATSEHLFSKPHL